MTAEPERPTGFAQAWDRYAERARAAGQRWPGDDWGDAALWDAWFTRLFARAGVADWQRAVEIGQGTGKYTSRVLAASNTEVLACDVSRRFLELCGARLAPFVAERRLHLRHVSERDPVALSSEAERLGWLGRADAVYAIDTLVHVPFTHLVAYLLDGARVLRPDGWFVASFADATSDNGRTKLLRDLRRVISEAGAPETGCFHWISPDLLSRTATAIGYHVEVCDTDPVHHRDGHFVARLRDPDAARHARTTAGLQL